MRILRSKRYCYEACKRVTTQYAFVSCAELLRGEYGKVLKPYKVQLNSCTTQDFSHSASQHNKGSNTENDEDAAHG